MYDSRVSRRLTQLLVIAALVAVAGALAAWRWPRRAAISEPGDGESGAPPEPAGPAVRALFGPLADPGATVDAWKIVRVDDVRDGAIPVVMTRDGGASFTVDVLARDDGGPPAVATTTDLALYLVDSGNGHAATPEDQGLATMALAQALAAREAAGARPPMLMTMRERPAR